MKNTTYLKHLSLHTWSGIVFGLLLSALFLSGSVAVFHHEIEQWQQPVDRQSHLAAKPNYTLEETYRQVLQSADGEVEEVRITLPSPNDPALGVELHLHDASSPGGHRHEEHDFLINQNGDLKPTTKSEPGLAGFLAALHTHLHLPYTIAPYILGPIAFALFVALVTGLFIHRKLFGKLFTFRPQSNGRVAWLDLHTLFGVWTLPFLAIISLTSIPMALHYGPWLSGMAIGASGGNIAPTNYFQWFQPKWAEPSEQFESTTDLDVLLRTVTEEDAHFIPNALTVVEPDDANARILITGNSTRLATEAPVKVIDGTNGTFIRSAPSVFAEGSFWGNKLFQFMFSLHEGNFGGFTSRLLWFTLGIIGTLVSLSGQYIWILKRRSKATTKSQFRLCLRMEKLTVALGTGFAFAIVSSFSIWPILYKTFENAKDFGPSVWTFITSFVVAVVYSSTTKDPQKSNRHLLIGVAIATLIAPLARWIAFEDSIYSALQDGRYGVFVVDSLLLLCSFIVFLSLKLKTNTQASKESEQSIEQSNPPALANASLKQF